MIARQHLTRASWTVIDQGIVSAGGFLVSIVLARQLPAFEYGVFALLAGSMFALQLFNATLLVHPLSVLLVLKQGEQRSSLLKAALLLIASASAMLGAVLILILVWCGESDLILPASVCFLSGQLQEGTRRGLIAEFRHSEAAIGDAISYIGQVVVALGLVAWGALTLPSALYGIAATSALAALLQSAQLDLRRGTPLGLRRTIAEFWAVGGLWSLGNGLLSAARMLVLSWVLAMGAGPAATASLHAAYNVINLSNPLVSGMCNLIPQAAAQASSRGMAEAWRAGRAYLLVAAPPLLAYSLVVLAVPELLLGVVYGSGSQYTTLHFELRLLAVAGLAGYSTDMIVAFLHGVRAVPKAFAINAIGAAFAVVLALALSGPFGVAGSCVALFGANVARAVAVHLVLVRINGRRRRGTVPHRTTMRLGEIER